MKKLILLFIIFAFALKSEGQEIILATGAGRQMYEQSTCNFAYADARLMFSRPLGHRYRIGPWINYVLVDFQKQDYKFQGSYAIFGISLDKVWEKNKDNWFSPKYKNTYVWLNSGLRYGYAKDADAYDWQSWEKSKSLSFSGGLRIMKPMFRWFHNSEVMVEMEFPLRTEKRFSVKPGIIQAGTLDKTFLAKATYQNGFSFILHAWKGINVQPIIHLGAEYHSTTSIQYGLGVRLGKNRSYREPIKLVFFRDSKGSNNVALNINININ